MKQYERKVKMQRKKLFAILFGVCFCIFIGISNVFANGFLTLPLEEDFSVTSCFDCYPGHNGTDYGTNKTVGHVVVAVYDGEVIKARDDDVPEGMSDPNYGNYIKIDHGLINDKNHKSLYGHLLTGTFLVNVGDKVYRGQPIAQSGNSGKSTGPHLHLGIFEDGVAVDPYDEDNYLWTTNPPSHGVYNRFSFTFDNGSPQGFTCGFDTKEIKGEIPAEGFKDNFFIDITGPNPGIKSSSFSCGINPNDFVIIAKAGLLSSDRGDSAEVYLKDQAGDWDFPVSMKKIEALSPDEQAKVEMYVSRDASNTGQLLYQDPRTGTIWIFDEADYQIFIADLSTAARKPKEVKQFSLEFVNKNEGRLLLDDVVVCSKATSWDFGDVEKGQMGWTILKDATHADFFPAGAGY